MDISQKKIQMRDVISKYFGNAVMTKMKENNSFSIYYARIGCLLCLENRYIVVVLQNDDSPIGTTIELSEMEWISFQTRTIENPNFKIKPKDIKSETDPMINCQVEKISDESDRTVYISYDFPIKLELLKENESDVHRERGTLKTALDSYNCVLSFNL
jgi:hypothetical protein